jgi:NADH:ubiquinone oxidoreductase subunit C
MFLNLFSLPTPAFLNLYKFQMQYIFFISFCFHLFGCLLKEIKLKPCLIDFQILSTDLHLICFIFKKHSFFRFGQLIDIIGIDLLGQYKRFGLFYQFLSLIFNIRIQISILLGDLTSVLSLVSLYSSAGWYEREVWDLLGIFFSNNLDLRRILTDYGFEGHPLRKDFPLVGFVELFYDDVKQKFLYEKILLVQDYRYYKFVNPWINKLQFKF